MNLNVWTISWPKVVLKVSCLVWVDGRPIKVMGKLNSPSLLFLSENLDSIYETSNGLNRTSKANSLLAGIVKLLGTNCTRSLSQVKFSLTIWTGSERGFSIVINFELGSLTILESSNLASLLGGLDLRLILKKINSCVYKFLKNTFSFTYDYFKK